MDAVEVGNIFYFQVSQGSIVTHLWWGGNFYNAYI